MDRETRLNLWFLILIVILLAPGAVILVRKKLDPAAKPMYLPDAMPRQAAYNDAAQTNPRLDRTVPPLTGQWVRTLAQRHWTPAQGIDQATWHQGLVSDRRSFEVVVSQIDDQGLLRLGLITWDTAMTDQPASLNFAVDGQPMRLAAFTPYALPPEIRGELQGLRFVNPPRAVGWVELTTKSPWPGTAQTLPAVAEVTVEARNPRPRLWADRCPVVMSPP